MQLLHLLQVKQVLAQFQNFITLIIWLVANFNIYTIQSLQFLMLMNYFFLLELRMRMYLKFLGHLHSNNYIVLSNK